MIHKSLDEIITSYIKNFASSQNTMLEADVKPGSITRGMIEAFAMEMDDVYKIGDYIEEISSVSTATGTDLDAKGMSIGCMRINGESDEDYRADIYNYLADSRTCSIEAVEKAIREIAGIESFKVRNLAYGAGTFSVYIRPKTDADTSVLYNSVYNAVLNASAPGIYFDVIFPKGVIVNMDISILCSDLTDDIIAKVKSSITNYLTSLDSGQTLLFPLISQTVTAEVPAVNSIYIQSITFDNKTCYAQQYALLDDEQFTVNKINIIN